MIMLMTVYGQATPESTPKGVNILDAELHLSAFLHNKYAGLGISLYQLMPLRHVYVCETISTPQPVFFAGSLLNYTIRIPPYNQLPVQAHPVQVIQDFAIALLQALHVGILHLRAEK